MLADKFDMAESAGLFESAEESQFGFIASRAYAQPDFNAAILLHRFDAHDAHSAGQHFLQIHEHLRPVEAARVQDGVEKSRAIMEHRVIPAAKEAFEVASLLLVSNQFPAGFLRPGTQLGIGFPDDIYMPSQKKKRNSGDDGNQPGSSQKSSMGSQRLCREIKPDSHS